MSVVVQNVLRFKKNRATKFSLYHGGKLLLCMLNTICSTRQWIYSRLIYVNTVENVYLLNVRGGVYLMNGVIVFSDRQKNSERGDYILVLVCIPIRIK